jgi:hypothetical protein
MTSRRVGRPCAKTEKTVKIKIKKEPKTIKIKIKKEAPVKKARQPVRKPPPVKKARQPVRKPPPLINRNLVGVRLLNSNNRMEKDKIKRVKAAKAFKERARIISATNRQKVANRRFQNQLEKEIKMEEAKLLADMRAQSKISTKFRKDMLMQFKGGSFADKARGI